MTNECFCPFGSLICYRVDLRRLSESIITNDHRLEMGELWTEISQSGEPNITRAICCSTA